MSSTTPTLRHQISLELDSEIAGHSYFSRRTIDRSGVAHHVDFVDRRLESGLGASTITKKIPRLLCGSAWLPCLLRMQRGD
jgi:hypothetical protein